jgi:DNA-binding transcriptional MerR regulator
MEITTDIAAKLLGVNPRSIQRYGDLGLLHFRVRGRKRFRRYDLNHLREVAPSLNLDFDETYAQELQQAEK